MLADAVTPAGGRSFQLQIAGDRIAARRYRLIAQMQRDCRWNAPVAGAQCVEAV